MGVFKLVIAFVYLVAPKRAVWFIGRRTRISISSFTSSWSH